MKKYNQVKVIDEENEEEINEEIKDESNQNEFFIKDQEPNERRKMIRSEKLKMENERSKTLINFNKLFEAIGWNKDDNNNAKNINQSFILINLLYKKKEVIHLLLKKRKKNLKMS